MKDPIFIYEPTDLCIFRTKELAERYLEPTDVRERHFTYLDSEGRVLLAKVNRDRIGQERVSIESTYEKNAVMLKEILTEFLDRVSEASVEGLEAADLKILVQRAMQYASE